MKITAFRAERFKRLSVVEITPDGNLVQITGRNGNGKSSVLDAIEATLAGADHVPGQPIAKGKDHAMTRVTLKGEDKDEWIVERRYTAKNPAGTLSISTPEGSRFKSPQAMLDALMGRIGFDPLHFMRLKPAEQAATLRSVVTLEIDPDVLDRQRAKVFDDRTALGRQLAAATARADGIMVAPNLPDEAPDVDALVQEMAEISNYNSERDKLVRAMDEGDASRARLVQQIAEPETLLATAKEQLVESDKFLANRPSVPPAKNPADIQKKITEARLVAEAITERDRKESAQAEVLTLTQERDALTAKIEEIDAQKADALAKAKMPIPGLSFADGVVTFGGVPLDQASSAEQLRISAAIGAALNPKLKVMLCRDGSLLDSESLKLLATFADEAGMQIFLERVEESGEIGVVMEDGHVRGQEELVAEFEKTEGAATAPAKENAPLGAAEPTEEERTKALAWLAEIKTTAAELVSILDLEKLNIRVKRVLVRYPEMLASDWNTFYLERVKATGKMRTTKPKEKA